MRLTALCICLALLLSACRKESRENNNEGELRGRYTGTFARTGMDTARVEFLFRDDNTFEGSSDHTNYPAICSGSFDETAVSLEVNDTCTWTANFDWTLIFDGNYSISYGENNSVRIWRSNGNSTDEYLLVRYTR